MSEALAALVAAVSNGDVETARSLLDTEPALARKQQGGASPLHYAAIHGQRNAVDLLIDRGADVEDLDTEYRAAPIGWANEKGHMDLVRHLRERGTNVSLHMAAAFGFDDDVERLASAHPGPREPARRLSGLPFISRRSGATPRSFSVCSPTAPIHPSEIRMANWR